MIAEPLEILIVAVAAVALLTSLRLCWQTWLTARTAADAGRCEAVRELAWLRVRNELLRAVVVACVLYSGFVQMTAPPPMAGSPYRHVLQLVWVVIAGCNLALSVGNDLTIRRVIKIIERERTNP